MYFYHNKKSHTLLAGDFNYVHFLYTFVSQLLTNEPISSVTSRPVEINELTS